jgi:hypothetical protein
MDVDVTCANIDTSSRPTRVMYVAQRIIDHILVVIRLINWLLNHEHNLLVK